MGRLILVLLLSAAAAVHLLS